MWAPRSSTVVCCSVTVLERIGWWRRQMAISTRSQCHVTIQMSTTFGWCQPVVVCPLGFPLRDTTGDREVAVRWPMP